MSVKFDLSKIGSPLYNQSLTDCFTKIIFKNGDKETNVRVSFETGIKIFLSSSNIVSNPYDVINMFKAEEAVKNPADGAIYFIDSSFKNIIIEYKRYRRLDSEADLKSAIEQLTTYMTSDRYLSQKNIYGFLFDGMQMHCFYKDDDGVVNKIEEYSGTFSVLNFDFFIRTLANIEQKDITPHNLTDDFKVIDNTQNSCSLDLFRCLFNVKKVSINKRTKLLYSEWEKMFKLSEADNETRVANAEVISRRRAMSDLLGTNVNDAKTEYEALFALHTTYSIIIKLISVNACKDFSEAGIKIDFIKLSKLSAINDIHEFLSSVENGKIYRSFGITNMIQGDFFSWYLKESLPEDFYSIIKNLFVLMSKYQNFSLKTFKTKDYLRELYENTIPREIRHSFGEYYTPYYLADCVIKRSLERQNLLGKVYKSLDPTCGSGTFVLANISRLLDSIKDKSNKEKLNLILNNAYGVDLNPLAVLSSKINYLINIAPLNDYTEEIEIPIYLGDSSYMPSICYVDGVECVEYDFFTDVDKENNFIHFCLPMSLIKHKHFISAMNEAEDLITAFQQEKAVKYILQFVDTADITENVIKNIKELVAKLVDLETKDLNSIWLGIFASYLKASTISDCDIVSGNPPWVDWKNLPEKYRDRLKISAKNTNIFSDDKNVGGVSLNICALIALKCVEKYISQTGELSFLMPKAILFNKSFEGFRKLDIDGSRYCFSEIDDWEKGGKPFDPVSIKFCIFNICHKTNEIVDIPYFYFKLNRGEKISNIHNRFDVVENKFTISEMKSCVLENDQNNPISVFETTDNLEEIKKVIGNKEYELWHRGLGLCTNVHKLYYVKEHETDSSLAYFETFVVPAGSNQKRLSGNRVVLEKRFVRPFVETPQLGFYKLLWENLYTTYPYYEGQKTPVPYDELLRVAPRLAHYLKAHQQELENQSEYNSRVQSNDEFYGIIRVGFYSYNNYFACMRDNNNVICCPVLDKIKTHWDEEMIPKFDGHVAYDSEITKNVSISKDEVLYLAGIINTEYVRKYIENSSDSQSIGSKFDINLPYFDNTNIKHESVLVLSKLIYELVNVNNLSEEDSNIQYLMKLIQKIYISFNDSLDKKFISNQLKSVLTNAVYKSLFTNILIDRYSTSDIDQIMIRFN